MALSDTQDTALANLATLLTKATTDLERVYIDAPGSLNETPCMVVFDAGMTEERSGGWREILWDLELAVYVSEANPESLKKARTVRAKVLEQLGTDITLGGAISNSLWVEPFRLAALQYGTVEYDGARGMLRLVIRGAKAYA